MLIELCIVILLVLVIIGLRRIFNALNTIYGYFSIRDQVMMNEDERKRLNNVTKDLVDKK